MNDTGIKAAMRTANAGWWEFKKVMWFGYDHVVHDDFAKATFHYKLHNGKLYFIKFIKD